MTMVRHHQDSSQLSLALFGGGGGGAQGVPKLPSQMRNSTSQIDQIPRQSNYETTMTLQERRQREWEANSMSLAGGFWGQSEKNTPPTDKPPDKSRQISAYHHPFDKPTTHSSQNQSYHQLQQQLPQRLQMQPYQGSISESPQYQAPMSHHVPYQQGYFTSDSLGGVQTPMSPSNMYPFTIPVGMPNAGYNNGAPVYFIMAPPNGISPQLLPDMLKHMPSNPPQTSQQLILESVSSASSVGSRWSPSPDNQRSLPRDPNKSLSRAKWGEKGVGVGHLWDPEVSVKIPTATGSAGSVPPNWAEQCEGTMHAGGHTPGEKTHARGQAVVLDAQERAERQRKQRQAQETQRIIQQQLDEKKKQQEAEIERERKDAAIWEEKLKEQREKERKEIEEEQKKKRDKEELEERRQEKLREAIEAAALKAKREKDEARFGRSKTLISEKDQLKIEPELSQSVSATPRKDVLESARPEKKEVISTSITEKEVIEETTKEKVATEDKEKEILAKINLPDLVSSAQLGSLDQSQKMAILRALGIAPDFLFSSGAFDKSTFMSLLGQSYANNVPLIKEDGGEYIRNVVLTPTKFRRARDCGIQCDDVLSDGYEEERGSRSRRFVRRQRTKSVRENSLSSPEKKPQWGRHKSERPYKKQSDKDPYSNRKIRRRPISISGRDNGSNTEESDPQQIGEPRRRRKTWNESRQESLSSDFSRSPSPKSRKGSKISFKGPPPIKPPLTPITPLVSNFNSEKLSDSASMQSFKISPSVNSAFTIYKGRDDAKEVEVVGGGEAERTDSVEKQDEESTVDQSFQNISQTHDDDADVTITTTKFRTDSPPVPALKGGSSFDIPEYPPGADPEEIINRPIRRRSSKFNSKMKTKNKKPDPKLESIPDSDYKKSESNPELNLLSRSVDETISQSNSSPNFDHLQTTSSSTNNSKRSPRPPAVRKSRKASLPVIYTPDESEFYDIPITETNVKSRKKPLERRASLTGGPRTEGDQVPKINSVTRPSSKTSHTTTPRRLPPMPYSPSQICREGAGSPPVPAIQQKMLENSLNGRSIETFSLVESSSKYGNHEKITPVEVTPRIRTGMSNVHPTSSSPTSISTGNDSSSEIPLKSGRRRKKESADSGVSEMMSRPDSTSSLIEEQLGTPMNSLLSSQSSIYRRPRDLTAPPDDPEQWVVLKSLSSIRQNFWRKSQDLSLNTGADNGY